MSRSARQASESGYYHVIMRGNNKRWIFKGDRNKDRFLGMLEEQIGEDLIQVAAWCVMDNHVHLVLKADKENLTRAIKRINIKYAMGYNKRMESSGHVFQDRFKSQRIETDAYLMQVVRYVHNNPVKAGLVESPEDYEWSSFRSYLREAEGNGNSQIAFVLSLFNGDREAFMAFHALEDEQEHLEIKEDLIRQREEKAQKIITEICGRHGIIEAAQLQSRPEAMNDMIRRLADDSKLSYRKIAELTGVSYNRVRDASKGTKRARKE